MDISAYTLAFILGVNEGDVKHAVDVLKIKHIGYVFSNDDAYLVIGQFPQADSHRAISYVNNNY